MAPHNLPDNLMDKNAEFPSSGKAMWVTGLGWLLAWGTTVPTDADTDYAPGCIFVNLGGSTSSTMIYVNIGTRASCNFDALTGA